MCRLSQACLVTPARHNSKNPLTTQNSKHFESIYTKHPQIVNKIKIFQKFFTFPIAEKTEITNFADVTGAEFPTNNL